MGAGHSHGHATGRAEDRSRLKLVLLVTSAVIAVELVGGWLGAHIGRRLSPTVSRVLVVVFGYVVGVRLLVS